MSKNSETKGNNPFRKWLREMWMEHLDELNAWNQPKPNYDVNKYFQMYKWWLKREYRFQNKQEP
mgnify:CR=1 FL=1